jgi:MinD superfamily P-loop ATPase
MTVRMINRVQEYAGKGINILDSPPGTSCPVVAVVKDADLCVFVTDPTPFGVNDLKLAVDMARELGQEPVVVVNRAEYYNSELKDYCAEAGLEIIGEIPDDRKIAEVYSDGGLAVEKLPEYREIFSRLAEKILQMSKKKKSVKNVSRGCGPALKAEAKKSETIKRQEVCEMRPDEIVIISGKGGTGKTSVCASFAALAKNSVIADCDVDAADLHLILKPQIREKGGFSGGQKAEIFQSKCRNCGVCKKYCRFSAVIEEGGMYSIDPLACEGCGVCALVCPQGCIDMKDAVNGEWYVSDTRFGPMSHAKLGVAEENSGKLVSLVRAKLAHMAQESGRGQALIDGSPGTGCPVISSLVGSKYAVIVTEPTVSGIHDMQRILDVAAHFNIPSGVIVNKADLNEKKTEEVRIMTEESGSEFLGTIPYDKAVTEAQVKGVSVVEYSGGGVSESVKKIWEKAAEKLKIVRGGSNG